MNYLIWVAGWRSRKQNTKITVSTALRTRQRMTKHSVSRSEVEHHQIGYQTIRRNVSTIIY